MPARAADARCASPPSRCAKEKDAEDPACQKYASFYRSICPTEWVRCRPSARSCCAAVRQPVLQPATLRCVGVLPASATRCVRLRGAVAGALCDTAPKRLLLTHAASSPQVDRWNEQRENGNWPGRY